MNRHCYFLFNCRSVVLVLNLEAVPLLGGAKLMSWAKLRTAARLPS
jgi:hypothetical protein